MTGSPKVRIASHAGEPAESSDTPSFDVGGFVVGESEEDAVLFGKQSVRRERSMLAMRRVQLDLRRYPVARYLTRSPGILAGVPFFDEVFRQLDCSCVA